jgi:hypothetical protein
VVAQDKASVQFLDSPRRREAASCHLQTRSKAVGNGEPGGFAPRGRLPVRTRLRWVSDQHRSGTPWSDRRQAYALAGTAPTYFRVLSVSRGFDRWAGSGGRAAWLRALATTD